MVKKAVGKIVPIGGGATRYISVPSIVAKDGEFPFDDGEYIMITLEGKRLIVEKLED